MSLIVELFNNYSRVYETKKDFIKMMLSDEALKSIKCYDHHNHFGNIRQYDYFPRYNNRSIPSILKNFYCRAIIINTDYREMFGSLLAQLTKNEYFDESTVEKINNCTETSFYLYRKAYAIIDEYGFKPDTVLEALYEAPDSQINIRNAVIIFKHMDNIYAKVPEMEPQDFNSAVKTLTSTCVEMKKDFIKTNPAEPGSYEEMRRQYEDEAEAAKDAEAVDAKKASKLRSNMLKTIYTNILKQKYKSY